MPRDLPIGNGQLLIAFNRRYQLCDLFFPRVGKENHSGGHPFRFGVWCDGAFSWTDDPAWTQRLAYEDGTLVTDVVLEHQGLGLRLRCRDCVDFHENVYVRQVEATDLAGRAREVRLFFHHDFHISESDVGDTAYYRPPLRAVIHYKDRRYFLMAGATPGHGGVDQYATGTKEHGGAEGTWRDAEDGRLSGNPIAQGSVDSVLALHLAVPAGGSATAHYWMAVGDAYREVLRLYEIVRGKGPAELLRRTANYWRLWGGKEEFDYHEIPGQIVALFRQSLLILRTQIDNGGAIIAANDSDTLRFGRDTYSYMWPRDGALVAHALDMAGYAEITRRFYDLCAQIITAEGYFLHKYNPDGSLASSWHPWVRDGEEQLPIQEDETGLVLWALWDHFDRYRDIEDVKPYYRGLIVRAAEFLAAYRDPVTGLPRPSYDLWEERRGVLAFTVAAVHAGLVAAGRFAAAFGETERAARYWEAAQQIRLGADQYLWHPGVGRFVRMLTPKDGGGPPEPDLTLDASLYGLFYFGMYAPDDPRIVATMEAVRDRLWVKTEVGGVARYENDHYHQVSQDLANVPGNPWFICTLWLAQWYIARAARAEELSPALEIIEWVAARALPSGVLAEQVDPYTNAPLSVSPLTWSHATLIMTVLEYLDRGSELQLCPTCGRPLYFREESRLRRRHRPHTCVAPTAPEHLR